MEFKKENIYTALNADESLIGAKGYFADSIALLKDAIQIESNMRYNTLNGIDNDLITLTGDTYSFFYLVEPAPEKWYVTHTSYNDKLNITEKGLVGDIMFVGSKEECEQWIVEHSKPKFRPFKNCDELIKTYKEKLLGEVSKSDTAKLYMPTIWVLDNKNGIAHSITDYDLKMNTPNCIKINGDWEDLEFLFKYCSFLDGSVCGVEE